MTNDCFYCFLRNLFIFSLNLTTFLSFDKVLPSFLTDWELVIAIPIFDCHYENSTIVDWQNLGIYYKSFWSVSKYLFSIFKPVNFRQGLNRSHCNCQFDEITCYYYYLSCTRFYNGCVRYCGCASMIFLMLFEKPFLNILINVAQ